MVLGRIGGEIELSFAETEPELYRIGRKFTEFLGFGVGRFCLLEDYSSVA